MVRIGKLTGKVYDENVSLSLIGECCVICEKEDVDKNLNAWKMGKINQDCDKCRGCPEYYRDE